jgi:prolyl-tRNA synthetase
MYQSNLFCKTKKNCPQEIEAISHQLLYKADFIDQLGAGIYSFLPLGWKVHQNIVSVIRDEMEKIGAQEVFLPSLHPKAIWQKTGRWENIKPPLFKVRDQHKKEFALGSTHEEIMAKIAKGRITSYKDMPIGLFQFQNKFRNEMRYTGGLLRTREFIMKDLYSFHASQKDFEEYYEKVAESYLKIFERCGLKALRVKASGEGFTKDYTDEFQAITPVGEDTVIFCDKCGFAQNKEVAEYDEGEKCPKCGSPLKKERGIEIGNIFPLGTKYSEAFDLTFRDKEDNQHPIIMASYGIGVGRLISTVVEANNDEKGIIWPEELAPFLFHIIPVEIEDKRLKETAEKIYQDGNKFLDRLMYDDRKNVSIGEKFIESDLIGIPYRIVISKKTLEKDSVELRKRASGEVKLIKIKELMKSNFYDK